MTTRRWAWLWMVCAILVMAACGGDDSGGAAGTGDTTGGSDAGWNPGSEGDGDGRVGASDAGGGTHSSPDVAEDSGGHGGGGSDTSGTWDASGGWDSGSPDASPDAGGGNTNVNLGGAQDFGYVRRLLDEGMVPHPDDFDAAGFFAEHHTPLPTPDCGDRLCLQTMLGVLANLINGNNCTLLQIGINSPLTADPANRPPLDLTVVVDVSGSMADENKLAFVRDGLELMIDAMVDEDRIAIIAYSSEANIVLPMTDIRLNRADIGRTVRELESGGQTNLYDGLRLGYQTALADYDSGRQARVILLSDGLPSTGITDLDAIFDMSGSYNSEGIGITTIGVGTSFDLQLMRGIAEQGDGNFYFVESAAAVDEVFTEEISYFTVPVAYDLHIEMSEGADYAIAAVHGSRLWEATADGGELSIPSVFLAHRVSHDDVTEGGGRRGGGSALMIELMPLTDEASSPGQVTGDVGTVHLTFREPGTDAIIEQEVRIDYPHAPWILLRSGHFDAPGGRTDIIQKSFVMLNIFGGMRMAAEAFHELGSAEVEVAMLEGLIAAVEDYNEEIGDVDIEYDLALLRQFVDVLLANGAVPLPPEWEEPEDGWPCD